MDLEKTGRLIAKRRGEMNLTLRQLSKRLGVTPEAVSNWENGDRFPDASSQIMIDRIMGLNPVELLSGTEMYDEKLKKAISYYMSRIDEKVFTGGIVTDEDGNESYLDMSDFKVVMNDENGEPSDNLIPYLEYHNAEPHVMTEHEKEVKAQEDSVPKEQFDVSKIYINYGPAIFIIPKEILEDVGKPRFFNVCRGDDGSWVGLQFGESGNFDIPDEVYSGSGRQSTIHGTEGMCRGLMLNGGEFGRELCRQMGISHFSDKMVVAPYFSTKHNMLVMDLIEAKRVKVEIDLNVFALPTVQFEEELQELMEDEAEAEE